MNEKNIKILLQNDAKRLNAEFSEDLLGRIMTEVQRFPVFDASGNDRVESERKRFFSRSFLSRAFFYSGMVGASVLLGVGLWLMTNAQTGQNVSVPQNVHQASRADRLFEIPISVNSTDESVLEAEDFAQGETVELWELSGLQNVRHLSDVILPEIGIVCLRHSLDLVDVEDKTEDWAVSDEDGELGVSGESAEVAEELPGAELLADIWSCTASVLSAPVLWVFEEE